MRDAASSRRPDQVHKCQMEMVHEPNIANQPESKVDDRTENDS